MNAMVGNSKFFYAGYLTTNIKLLASFMISYNCIFEIWRGPCTVLFFFDYIFRLAVAGIVGLVSGFIALKITFA